MHRTDDERDVDGGYGGPVGGGSADDTVCEMRVNR